MRFRRFNRPVAGPNLALPIAALGLVALVPAACVLWFTSAAMRNERLAVEARLNEAYASQLALLARRSAEWARARQAALTSPASGSPTAAFAALVHAHLADSVVLYDANGQPRYPHLLATSNADLSMQFQQLKLRGRDTPEFVRALDAFAERLADYSAPEILPSQRRFLMHGVVALDPSRSFSSLAAEDLAAEYLEHAPAPLAESGMQRTVPRHVWRLANADRTVVGLFHESRIQSELATQFASLAAPEVRISVLPPGASPASGRLPAQDIGDLLAGWRIALTFPGVDPFAEASARQTRVYQWASGVAVVSIALVVFFVARYVRAQVRLARLKDELVSTVSHELKTPLASMRALVDTLVADRCRDAAQRREYLQLVARENLRLSHLIENFLAFSRMEGGQQRFAFESLRPDAVIATAVGALQDRFAAPDCRLTTKLAPDLPSIRGDADALATVLINLLDNACKYSDGEKRIRASAYTDGSSVCFEVADNGVGLERSEAKRIFERFYQVDQSLTRQRGGCGLGLSIVQAIVRAHGGTVAVESELGKGSVFRVKIPAETLNAQRSTLNAQVCTTDTLAKT